MRVLVTGWFSFDPAEVTAGDLLARDTALRWLREAGADADVAVAANFRRPGELALDDVRAGDYTDVLFVCGPAAGRLPEQLLCRFPHAQRVALDVSAVPGTAALPLDRVLARDGDGGASPDLSLATATEATPVVGVVLGHEQPEYAGRQQLRRAHRALDRLLTTVDVAPVPVDTRLHPGEAHLCSTPGQLEAVLARMDAVVTTRLHGLVLALKVGVPAVALDPVAGGGKVAAQAQALGWPAAAVVDHLPDGRLRELLAWCLGPQARHRARDCAERARPRLDEVRRELLDAVGVADALAG